MTIDDLIEDSSERLVETYATLFHTGQRSEGGINAVIQNMREAMLEHDVTVTEFLTMLTSYQAQQIVLIVSEQDDQS
jgi:signal recognition particle GTPase